MKKTDWTKYYDAPYRPASFTRKITGRALIENIKAHIRPYRHLRLTELGGANSAFLELILEQLDPEKYTIIDFNKPGLEKTKPRIAEKDNVVLCHKDILNDPLDPECSDLVLSIGLVEHFDPHGTRKAIKAHFDLLRPGGYAVITFPTPTFLYRASRFVAETLGLWIFHDERPLHFKEVLECVRAQGQVLGQTIIWPIFFTQGLVVCQKKRESVVNKPGGPA